MSPPDGKRRPLLQGLSEEDRRNIPLLLERLYLALVNELDDLSLGIRKSIDNQSRRISTIKEHIRLREDLIIRMKEFLVSTTRNKNGN